MKKAVIILGPTATGKTKLALKLSEKFPFEIISADSMQFYKEMDIGTDKVPADFMKKVPHHLIDIITIEEEFSIAKFKKLATKKMKEIVKRNKIPLIVGGSGLYIRTLTENFPVEEFAPPDKELRSKLEDTPIEKLREIAEKIDPEAVSKIGKSDRKRLIRVIEFFEKSGRRISEVKNAPPEFEFLKIGLIKERGILYRDIENRIEEMFEQGFIDEVKRLREKYPHWSKTALQAIGYKEVSDFLDGKITLSEAKEKMKLRTRHLAKRQITWFKKEKNVIWINSEDFENAFRKAQSLIEEFLRA